MRFPISFAATVWLAMPLSAQMPPQSPASNSAGFPSETADAHGASLQETIAFITSKINAQGNILSSYAYFESRINGPIRMDTVESAMVRFDNCVLTVQATDGIQGYPQNDNRHIWKIDLKNAVTIKISSLNEDLSNFRITSPPTPNYFRVNIFGSDIEEVSQGLKGQSPDKIAIPFYDHDIAVRVAKAFAHAIILCSGGKKEPF